MSYIMESEAEPDRIRFKTVDLVTRHHLDWMGFQPGESFVDFGCASGEVVRAAARIAGSSTVYGVDADPQMLAFARQESERLGLTNIAYHQAHITGLESSGLARHRFDHAWTRFFLEYQPNPLEAIREMTRVVRPGGKVTLIDIDGNCIWHYPMTSGFRERYADVLRDLTSTGFDPHIGKKLHSYAERAGLLEIKESIEPYHYIVGTPAPQVAEAWTRKIEGIKENYSTRLFPAKASAAIVFDELLQIILSPDTMTWSNLHLVQGRVPLV